MRERAAKDIIGCLSLIVAVVALGVSVTVPEIREALNLEREKTKEEKSEPRRFDTKPLESSAGAAAPSPEGNRSFQPPPSYSPTPSMPRPIHRSSAPTPNPDAELRRKEALRQLQELIKKDFQDNYR